MRKSLSIVCLYIAVCSLLLARSASGQNLQSYVSDMNKALGQQGSVALFDRHVLLFTFPVPGPEFIFTDHDTGDPKTTKWTIMTLDVSSITVDLTSLNEDKISDWAVFSPTYFSVYKPGDTGDMTLVGFETTDEKLMSKTTIDRDRLGKLKPGQATGEQLGTKTITSNSSMIAFSDRLSARAFEKVLRVAIVVAKAQ